MAFMKIKNFQRFEKPCFPKLLKKARISGFISFILVVLVVILLIFLIRNGWDIKLAAQDILGLFGAGKK